MNSKERFRAAVEHKTPDRIPRDFGATGSMMAKLQKHYGCEDSEEIFKKFSDVRLIFPPYIGRPLENYIDTDGLRVEETYFGYKQKYYPTGNGEFYPMNVTFPWDFAEEADDIKNIDWLRPDYFDYETFKRRVDRHPDKAIGIGGPGMYQYSTFMRSVENLYMDMAGDTEIAHAVFDRFVDFELEYYERQFQAADGQIDFLLCNDDYGTQISMLFSIPMWREFFKENTKKIAALAHKYGAFYMQHSCGAIRPIIPELIDCKVDMLDPLQKVEGLDPESLQAEFGGKITFHGGIDTQWLLPGGTPEEVKAESRRFIDVLGQHGGYILAPSQVFQSDVPVENVEAMYSVIE